MQDAMGAEHQAWLDMVADFRELGINVNDEKYNPLVKSICLWGERLVYLRVNQTVQIRVNALLNARADWDFSHK